MLPAVFPEEGLTLQQAYECLTTPEEIALLKKLREASAKEQPSVDDSDLYWLNTSLWRDTHPERRRDDRLNIEEQIHRIELAVVARLRNLLSSNELDADGYPVNGERTLIPKELWSVLKFDFRTSSAFQPNTKRRFDGIRIQSGKPGQLKKAILKKAETLPATFRAAVSAILEIWGPDGIPPNKTAKEWLPQVQAKAKELLLPEPAYRTTKNANDWIREARDAL